MENDNKKRKRLYAFLIYPDSAADGWIDTLKNMHIPGFISPMHHEEIDDNGEILKDHYHVFLNFDGVKSNAQFEEIRDSVKGVGKENVNSKIGYTRYLCHLDEDPNKKKHYDPNDVIELGGADYLEAISTAKNKRAMIREMIIYIRNSNIVHYTDLMDYAMENEPEWYDALCNSCSYVINTYISDNRIQYYESRRR